MTALAKDKTDWTRKGYSGFAGKVANGIQTYAGGYAALGSIDHATAAKRGYLAPWASAKGEIPMGGLFQRKVLGDTSLAPIPENAVSEGGVIKRATVTGVSAITDIGRAFYFSDDNVMTLTRPTLGLPAGVITRWYSSTMCDVVLLGFLELALLSLCGGNRRTLFLGSYDLDVQTAGNVATSIVMPFHGKFISFHSRTDVAPTGGGGTTAFNLELDGVDVTGGVVTVAVGGAGATRGDVVNGTAITALNEFHEGALLDIERIAGTDFTAGRVDLFAVVEPLLGL